MRTHTKIAALTFALAFGARIGVTQAQTDAQPEAAPQSIPGIIVLPPPQPRLPAGNQQDADTCPATDLKKLELVS